MLDHLHHPVLDGWMADPHMLLDGRLVVKGLDGSRFRTVAFREAFCVGEGMYFNGTGLGRATSLSVLISAKHLLIDDSVEFSNVWVYFFTRLFSFPMASFNAALGFEGQHYPIDICTQHMLQAWDHHGRPRSKATGAK